MFNEKTYRKPRTTTECTGTYVTVDWDSMKTCRRPRTDNNTRTGASVVKSAYINNIVDNNTVEEVIINNKPDVPGAVSLTTKELRGIGLV